MERVVLDLDRTNTGLHGEPEGRHSNGYYEQYCYTPLYIFAEDWPSDANILACGS